jgi:hypothetical protein
VRFVDDQGHDLLRASSGDVAFDDVDVTVSADEIRKVTKDLHDAGLSHFAAYQDSFAALYPSAASTSWAPPSGTASGGA